jgi:hypothetical protein
MSASAFACGSSRDLPAASPGTQVFNEALAAASTTDAAIGQSQPSVKPLGSVA